VVADLNIDLDSATLVLSRVHEDLEDTHARIVALEAKLEGRNPPEAQVVENSCLPPIRGFYMEP
jgi:BMFP domain-containing protein YqiC